MSALVVYYQECDGPVNYREISKGALSDVTLDTSSGTDNQYDYPLVTVEISTAGMSLLLQMSMHVQYCAAVYHAHMGYACRAITINFYNGSNLSMPLAPVITDVRTPVTPTSTDASQTTSVHTEAAVTTSISYITMAGLIVTTSLSPTMLLTSMKTLTTPLVMPTSAFITTPGYVSIMQCLTVPRPI